MNSVAIDFVLDLLSPAKKRIVDMPTDIEVAAPMSKF